MLHYCSKNCTGLQWNSKFNTRLPPLCTAILKDHSLHICQRLLVHISQLIPRSPLVRSFQNKIYKKSSKLSVHSWPWSLEKLSVHSWPWSLLPADLRNAPSLTCFRSQLKTCLFHLAFNKPVYVLYVSVSFLCVENWFCHFYSSLISIKLLDCLCACEWVGGLSVTMSVGDYVQGHYVFCKCVCVCWVFRLLNVWELVSYNIRNCVIQTNKNLYYYWLLWANAYFKALFAQLYANPFSLTVETANQSFHKYKKNIH